MRNVVWMVIAVVLIGGIVTLSSKDTTRPTVHVEKVIPDNALAH